MNEFLKRDYEYLLWLLSRRDYPEKKLREKLKARKVTPADADTLLQALKDANYFSEDRFRKARARQLTRRGEGPRSIKAKVRAETGHDLSGEELETVYSELNTSATDVLQQYLEKEHAKLVRSARFEPRAIRQKLIERAMRKGFVYDQIQKILPAVIS